MAEAIRQLGISEVTFYRWRKEYGGMSCSYTKSCRQPGIELPADCDNQSELPDRLVRYREKGQHMTNRPWLIVLILSASSVVLTAPTQAQDVRKPAVIVGAFPGPAQVTESTGSEDGITVSVFLPGMHGNSTFPSSRWTLDRAGDILAVTQAPALLTAASDGSSQLYFVPFDVHAATRDAGWDRVTKALDTLRDNYTLVISEGPDTAAQVLPDLTIDQVKVHWDNLFSDYDTVRALGLSDVIYIDPIAIDATKTREALLHAYESDLRFLAEHPADYASGEPIDAIFAELAVRQATSDAIAALDLAWRTEIRGSFGARPMTDREVQRTRAFVGTLFELLMGLEPYQCLVTVLVSGGSGATIKFYKSAVGQNSASDWEGNPGVLERAKWTFVSYRDEQSGLVETGRSVRVFNDPVTDEFKVTITERNNP